MVVHGMMHHCCFILGVVQCVMHALPCGSDMMPVGTGFSSTHAAGVLLVLMTAGQLAFVSGATAAVGSGVVKVPIAVCIRSVQAGVYPNVVQAARSIVQAAGFRGLFTVSTLLLRDELKGSVTIISHHRLVGR